MRELKFFRGRTATPATVHADDNLVVLEAEVKWVVRGPQAQLDRLAAALPPGRYTLDPGSLRLSFINQVGRFAVPGLGVLELRSHKLSERDFDALLADVAGVTAMLPFADHDGAGATHYPELTADPSLLYAAFVYLRQILSPAAPRAEQLQAAITAILAAPHERLVTVSELTQFRAARAVCMSALQRAISRADTWERCELGDVMTPWRQFAGSRAPRTIESTGARPSRDTAENQFVKHFLEHSRSIVRALLDRTRVLPRPDSSFTLRLRRDGEAMMGGLDHLLRASLWRQVGPLRQVPHGSTVLQRRHGYDAVLRHDIRLRALTRLAPLRELWRDLITIKDVARLYEIWCYLAVVDVMRARLGEPERALVVHTGDFSAKLQWGVEVWWRGGVSARYNPSFTKQSRPGQTGLYSTSILMRPDVCVVISAGPTRGLFVFDAKFSHHKGRVQHADLHVMHTYRDALRFGDGSDAPLCVRSAWVLFPGRPEGHVRYRARDGESAALAGIGAIPLRPQEVAGGATRAVLTDIIAEILPAPRPGP